MKRLLILLLAVLIVFSGCSRGAANDESAEDESARQLTVGIIYNANAVSIRLGPGTDYRIIDTVRRGGMCEIIDYNEDADWQEISYRGETAYISSDYLFATTWQSGDKLIIATINSTNMVNVRATPDISGEVLFLALEGEQYIVSEQDNGSGWIEISYPGGDLGYISSEYMHIRETTIDDALL
jgi:uncharacterized protein YgiM (DUF1202 family)